MNHHQRFDDVVRAAMMASEKPLELGWDVVRKARAATGAHLTDKELFLAGAGYLFDALVHSFTKESEPTQEDLDFISKIHKELVEFHRHFNHKLTK